MRAQETRTSTPSGQASRERPPSPSRGTAADLLLTLQSEAGNAAVSRAVQRQRRGHASENTVVQRAVWTFDGSSRTHTPTGRDPGMWYNTAGQSRSSRDLGVTTDTAHHGDAYDDATGQLYSSGNVKFSRVGKIPETEYPARESGTRRALVEAKQKLAATLSMLQGAGRTPGGQLLQALRSAFPAFRTAQPQQIGELLPRIGDVLRRVQAGLNARGAEIALVGTGSGTAPDVAGWVDPSVRDYANRLINPNQQQSEQPAGLATRSGPIHLSKKGEEAWTIIHEATHRFAGTLDYQYSPQEFELTEERGNAAVASHLGAGEAAAAESAMLGRRAVRDPRTYSGQSEAAYPNKQANWYAMGQRAVMNADSYAQFVLAATGTPMPRH